MSDCSITLKFDSRKSGAPIEAKWMSASTRAVKITKSWYVDAKTNDREKYMSSGGVYLRYNIALASGVQKFDVYVGETDNFCERFASHKSHGTGEELTWTSAILFKDEDLSININLRKAIETEIAEKCKKSGNCICKTSKTAKDSSLCDGETLNSYLCAISFLCRAFGFEWLDAQSQEARSPEATFVCESPKNKARGIGYMSANGFTICEGSVLSDNVKDSLKPIGYRNARIQIESDKNVVDGRRFIRSLEVSNASLAAAIIMGATSNGNVSWRRTSDKMTLGEYISHAK